MQKLFISTILILIFIISLGNVSAQDPLSFTSDQIINSTDSLLSYVDTNKTLPTELNISGSMVSMSQLLELLTSVLLNINNNSTDPITIGIYGDASSSSENITNLQINSSEYLDIANRVKDFMDLNGRAPNYATQSSTGNRIGFESLIYMYSQILNKYNDTGNLPDNINVTSWDTITTPKINDTNIIGSTDYGYVEKEIYGNQSSNQTIVLIIGVHPQENGIHTAVANALENQTLDLSKRYVIYKIHVTQDADDYTKGRMNGQLLAQKFVVPDVPKENPILAMDIHENHYLDSGYAYSRFLYPVSNTTITTTYANEIISKMPFLVIYTPPNHTSPEYVTIPIANYGIPTIIYETFTYDELVKKNSDANLFINALDSITGSSNSTDSVNPVEELINITATANYKTGLYNTTKNIILKMNTNGTIYYTTNNTNPTDKSNKYTGPFTITTTTTLKFIAIKENNKSPIYTEKYTIDKIAPNVTLTSPKNNAKDISRTAPIYIKFSETITKGTNFSNIYIKNMNTNNIAKSTVNIQNGNTITLKMNKNRLKLNNYQVYIPPGAVKDTAGNSNTKYILKFKTKKY